MTREKIKFQSKMKTNREMGEKHQFEIEILRRNIESIQFLF